MTDAEGKNPTDAVVDDQADATVIDQPSEELPKPSTEPEMISRQEAEKLANEKHSKLDKRISELEKATKQSTKALEAAQARAEAAQEALMEANRRVEEAERNALGDSPDALSLFEAKIKLRQATNEFEDIKAKWEAEKSQYADDIAEAKAYKVQKTADEIATEYGVEASLLVQLTDGSREKMERLAKSLPKKEAGDNKPNLRKPPDSGKPSGKFGNLTTTQLNELAERNPEAYYAYVEERNKKK